MHGPELTEPDGCTECDGYVNDHAEDCPLVAEPPIDLEDYLGADQ